MKLVYVKKRRRRNNHRFTLVTCASIMNFTLQMLGFYQTFFPLRPSWHNFSYFINLYLANQWSDGTWSRWRMCCVITITYSKGRGSPRCSWFDWQHYIMVLCKKSRLGLILKRSIILAWKYCMLRRLINITEWRVCTLYKKPLLLLLTNKIYIIRNATLTSTFKDSEIKIYKYVKRLIYCLMYLC